MKYNTIVIDPAWQVPMVGKFGRRPNRPQKLPYETMNLQEIHNFPIVDFAEEGAHVYLWTTNKFVRECFKVFDSWNVRFHVILVGHKPSGVAPNCGYIFGTEFCFLGIYKGKHKGWKKCGTLNHFNMFNKAGRHSSKPDNFYEIVESMSHAPYIDIFSRKNRAGWDSYGKEIGKFDTKQMVLT